MKVSDVLSHWLAQEPFKDPQRSRGSIAALMRLLGARDAEAVTGAELAGYRAERRSEGRSDSTINRELTYLRAAYNLALQDELVTRAPRVRLVREPPPREVFLTADQVARILDLLPPDDADVVEFLWRTGWRIGSALALTWDDINREAGEILCPGEKTKAGVPIIYPLEGAVREIIDRREACRNGLPDVFLRRGKPIKSVRAAWRRATQAAGLSGVRVHDLRRSLAHHHLACGVPPAVTMQLAGWRTDCMYRRYAIVDRKLLRDAIRRAEKSAEG